MAAAGEVDFKGTKRFTIEHRLGAGGMGVVYRAFDAERKAPIALKTLRSFDAQALYRFKNEFRALADIQHPNLIGLGELICDDGTWFFTMDLVDGQDFLAFVRPGQEPEASAPEATPSSDTIQVASKTTRVAASSADDTVDAPPLAGALARPPKFDEARLRAALAELALGVSALHAAGKVHRDIKPSNVMVTRTGKVVVLDFGLITDLLAGRESLSGQIVGTPAYMAPEQAAGAAVGPAADWYSVGMVLYEALTGRLPFRGTIFEIITAKQRTEPPPPCAVASGVPADLDALCRELLRIDPGARPEGRLVLERLGARTEGGASTKVGETSDALRRASTFVGRAPELAALRDAFDASRRGAPVTVFVHGESGLGKSELVRHFVEGLEGGRAGALVLAGRCYERESVPYKAFDGIVDALSRHLGRIDPVDAALLLPRDASLLVQVFPVLRRVSAIERLPASRLEGTDPLTIRTRAFLSLRELFAKLVERRPLVLGIDDFQWADADSQTLLREVLRPPEAPALLLLSTTRSETQPDLEGDVRRIDLKPLSPEETHALVHLLSGSSATDPAAIAREAGGHPLFIQELVRHAPIAGAHAPARLDDVLWARVGRLDAEARGLLEVVAVAGAPIAQEAIARAAGLDLAASARCVAVLRAENLVRTSGTRGQDAVEPYHDRVRESVLARLDEQTRRGRHRGIADALEGSGAAAADPNALLRHLEACGETARAAKQAEQAARLAAEGLAFERAAEMYGVALRLGASGEPEVYRLQRARADALANAGRGAEAAAAYVAASAATGEDAVRLACRVRAADHWLSAGHLDSGMATLQSVLADIGERLPRTRWGAAAMTQWNRFALWLRGLHWVWRERPLDPGDRARLEVYSSIGMHVFTDPIRARLYAVRKLRLALRSGDARDVASALLLEATYVGQERAAKHAHARRLVAEAMRVAQIAGDTIVLAVIPGAEGVISLYAGEFASAVVSIRRMETRLRDFPIAEIVGVSGMVASTKLHAGSALRLMGRFRELRQMYSEHVADADRRGDVSLGTMLRRGFNSVWLAADEPGVARREYARTDQLWKPQRLFELRSNGEIDLYCGTAADFLGLHRAGFAALEGSLVVKRVEIIRNDVSWLRGRLALAAVDLDEVSRAARRLERERLPYADVWASLLRAGIAFQSNDRAACERILRDAIPLAERHDMLSCAAAARRRLGDLLGGTEGAALISQADAWYASEGVKSPERMTDMLAPGFRRRVT